MINASKDDLITAFGSIVTRMEDAIAPHHPRKTASSFAPPKAPAPHDTSGEFARFTSAARSLIIEPLREELKVSLAEIESLLEWLDPHDVIAVGGVSGQENPYSDLLAWSLDPKTTPIASRHQREWLINLGLIDPSDDFRPARPEREYPIANGRVDLLLNYDDFAILIEAKTVSDEHEIDGSPQTEYYPTELQKRIGFQDKSISTIFLTVKGQSAKNPDAINTTFGDYAKLLCQRFRPDDYDSSERRPLSVLVTHFLNSAWTGKTTLVTSLTQARELAVHSQPNDKTILNQLDEMRAVLDLIATEK